MHRARRSDRLKAQIAIKIKVGIGGKNKIIVNIQIYRR